MLPDTSSNSSWVIGVSVDLGEGPIIFRVRPNTQEIIIRAILARNKCVCAFGLIGTIENKKLTVVKVRNFTNLTHREDLTASGNRMRDNEENCKTIAQVSQEVSV